MSFPKHKQVLHRELLIVWLEYVTGLKTVFHTITFLKKLPSLIIKEAYPRKSQILSIAFYFLMTRTRFFLIKFDFDPFLCPDRTMVINVEYNQLDPLLRATGHPDGDVNCETGYSPYPGNINQVKYFLQRKPFDIKLYVSLNMAR